MKRLAFCLSSLFGILAALDASAAPIIIANKDDNLAAGLRKFPGNNITYTTTIANTGDATATAVQFSDPDPAQTSFVSVNSTPLARADSYSAIGNVQITIAAASGVLVNDKDPDDSVNGAGTLTASAGAASTNGGNVSMSANGGFTYNPAPGFTGANTFVLPGERRLPAAHQAGGTQPDLDASCFTSTSSSPFYSSSELLPSL